MSDLKTIDELKKQFQESTKIKDVRQVAQSQQEIIDRLIQENELLKNKLAEMNNLMKMPSPEEIICIQQIEILKQASTKRELSLDEVKRLDLLVKNLRLVKEQSTENVSSPKYRDVTEAELVAIASSTDNQ